MINNTKKALLTLASILYSSAAFSYTPDEIYRLALENKVTELKQLKNIDLPDTSGNTALCRAKEENNQTAYRILLSAGASTNAPCMKKLSGRAGGEEIAAGVLSEEAATTTFLGLGATGWTITGLALLGGAAAAGGGGGGGGGSGGAVSSSPVACEAGYTGPNCSICSTGFIKNKRGKCVSTRYTKPVYSFVNVQGEIYIVNDSDTYEDDYGIHWPLYEIIALTSNDHSKQVGLYNLEGTASSALIDITNSANLNIIGMENLGKATIANLSTGWPSDTEYTATIKIFNTGNGNVEGLRSYHFYDAEYVNDPSNPNYWQYSHYDVSNIRLWGSGSISGTANIEIENFGNGRITGISVPGSPSIEKVYNVSSHSNGYAGSINIATGNIKLIQNGNGNANGISSSCCYMTVYNAASNGLSFAFGNIYIENNGAGNANGIDNWTAFGSIYNAYAEGDSFSAGNIIIKNTGTGNAIGINADGGSAYNAIAMSADAVASGNINIENYSTGTVYGIKGSNAYIYNDNNGPLQTSSISIKNYSGGKAYGIYSENGRNISSSGDISIINAGNGYAVGLFDKGGTIYTLLNEGNISILNSGNGTVVGMAVTHDTLTNAGSIYISNENNGMAIGLHSFYTDSFYPYDDRINNTGNIIINNLGNGTAIGIYAQRNAQIKNTGTISIIRQAYTDSNDVLHSPETATGGTAYGIYAETGATIINSGTINIDCSNFNTCQNIVLNGASLINAGVISATSLISTTAVTAFPGATFNIANDISGDLTIASEYVMHGFNMTYTATDLINADDASGLNPVSGSALFTASLSANQKDVVLQMKSFDSMISNKSLADFLAFNYANGKNEAFFNSLKAASSFTEFNDTLYSLTGKDTFKRLSSDDLSILRSLNFAVNEQLFKQREDDASWTFTGEADIFLLKNDQQSKTQFALLNQKLSDSFSIGYSMSASSITTDDKNQTTKKDELFQFSVPLTYRKDKLKATSSPMIGFANGNYTRPGLDQSYEGNIKRQFAGIMNEARYSFTVSNQLSLEPNIELNALALRQSGHESEGLFSLIIPADNRLSVESGIGFYVKYNHIFDKTSKFSLTSGITGYHEYAEPYNIKLAVKGMAGSFELYDHQARNRGLASFKLNYEQKDLSAYVHVYQFIESDPHTKIKAGLNLNF